MVKHQIQSIPIEDLVPHPDHPNRLSQRKFAKLVRNIERSGRYEPLVVRPCPAAHCHSFQVENSDSRPSTTSHPQAPLEAATRSRCHSFGIYPEQSRRSRSPDIGVKAKRDCFQIINGHYRWKVLRRLGYKTVEVVVWDVDDQDADILLATLNRLGGSDVLEKKLALMNRLNKRTPSCDLAKLLPYTSKQIHRLAHMHFRRVSQIQPAKSVFAHPVVFFLSDAQKEILEKALANAQEPQSEKTRAAKNAAALTAIAQQFSVKS